MFSAPSDNVAHNEQAQRLIQSYKDTLHGIYIHITSLHHTPPSPSPSPSPSPLLTLYSDPFASPEVKQAAERSLAALYQPTYGSATPQEHNNRVLGGYRATLANPNVSAAAKAHARAMLAHAGADPRTQRAVAAQHSQAQAGGQDAHLARQLGGYKSALKSESSLPSSSSSSASASVSASVSDLIVRLFVWLTLMLAVGRPQRITRGQGPCAAYARAARYQGLRATAAHRYAATSSTPPLFNLSLNSQRRRTRIYTHFAFRSASFLPSLPVVCAAPTAGIPCVHGIECCMYRPLPFCRHRRRRRPVSCLACPTSVAPTYLFRS
jgi:hypothetical protein